MSELLKNKISLLQNARPPRFVYLVQENEKASDVLDEIFKDSYNRWGGLATLIVPVIDGKIEERYITQIELCDPDVIYTYAELTRETFDQLNQSTKPFLFLKHSNLHSHKPYYKLNFLTSLSLAPRVIDDLQAPSGTKYLLRRHARAADNGFISDNFGFFPLNAELNLVCEEIQNYKPFTFLPKELPHPSDLDAKGEGVTSAVELLEWITKWENPPVYTPSLFSGKGLTSGFRPREKIKIFVGNSFCDRINFWNSRLWYCEARDINPSCLAMRLPEEWVQDDIFLEAFKSYLSKIGDINQYKFYSLISYSLGDKKLKGLQEKLGINQFSIEESSASYPYVPKYVEEQKFLHSEKIGRTEKDIQTLEPIYFQHIPPSLQFLKNGAWVIDLEIGRHHNLSCVYKEKQTWKLPRNHSVAKNFLPEEIARVNLSRDISFVKKPPLSCDGQYSKKPTKLTLPKDERVFNSLFKSGSFYSGDIRNNKEKDFWWKICPSDAGKLLEKFLKAFGSLQDAFLYMDNTLWVEIFRELKKHPKKRRYISIPKLDQKCGDNYDKEESRNELYNLLKSKFLVQEKKISCGACRSINYVDTYILGKKGQKRTQPCAVCKELLKDLYRFKVRPLVGKDLHRSFHESWVLGKLLMKYSETFFYLPQQDIFYSSNVDDKNEVDIICICDGNFVIGEAKKTSSQFKQKTIDKLIKISKVVHPDVVLLAYEKEDCTITHFEEQIKSAGFNVRIMKIFSKEKFSLLD
jgi:hypothetical protein